MQKIVLEEPYQHVPPRHATAWPTMFQHVLPWYLRKTYGIMTCEIVGMDRLRASLAAGHGIMLMPNHSRDEDGLVMGQLSCKLQTWFYYMSSWHLFKASWPMSFLLPRVGVYSVYREGPDRAAVKTSVGLLTQGSRPVVIFPEGYLGRTNDRLNPLMDGAALIARSAAKIRARHNPPSQVVVHPVAIRYRLKGPLEPGVAGVLTNLEKRLGLPLGSQLSLFSRLEAIEVAMLDKLENEELGRLQTGPITTRRSQLIQAILAPLEDEWNGHRSEQESVQSRVRGLRTSIVQGLVSGGLTPEEHRRRWRQLQSIYTAQGLDNYPPDYLAGQPTPERVLETIERLEEDLTDKVHPHVPLAVTVSIGEAIVVNPVGAGRGGSDPLLSAVEGQLRTMLGLTSANADKPSGVVAPR